MVSKSRNGFRSRTGKVRVRSGYEIRKGQVGGHVVSRRDWALRLYFSFPRVMGDSIITYFCLTLVSRIWNGNISRDLNFGILTNHLFSR